MFKPEKSANFHAEEPSKTVNLEQKASNVFFRSGNSLK
jgi:hypothetical protein